MVTNQGISLVIISNDFATTIDDLPVSSNNKTIQYFDGLGRLIQTVEKQASPTYKDIVQPVLYDQLGRQPFKLLSYTDGNDGFYKIHASRDPGSTTADYLQQVQSGDQYNYYQSANDIVHDERPFEETVYETSPLNRPLKVYGPGENWHINEKFNGFSELTNIHGMSSGQEMGPDILHL